MKHRFSRGDLKRLILPLFFEQLPVMLVGVADTFILRWPDSMGSINPARVHALTPREAFAVKVHGNEGRKAYGGSEARHHMDEAFLMGQSV